MSCNQTVLTTTTGFGYGKAANRLTQTTNDVTESWVYDERNRLLSGLHAACRPAASNELRRDDDTQAFLDTALSDVADGEVMSKEELLAALDQEIVLENRP